MKKRVLAVILGAVMTMSLAACGSSDAGKTSSDDGFDNSPPECS